MSDGKSPQDHIQSWEEKLIADYYDYRWHQLMEPMCEKMQAWKAGRLTHADMGQALEECHQRVVETRNLLSQRHDRLVLLIQYADREWFLEWVKQHAPPPGARVLPGE